MTSRRQKLARLNNRADRFERLVVTALRRAIKAGTDNLGLVAAAPQHDPAEPYVSLDDLAAIETAWQTELRERIMPQLGATLVDGAQDAIEDLVAQVPVLIDARHAAGELYLSRAENRLRHIGNDLWQSTRAQLLQGMAQGESIPKLSARVKEEIASSEVRARTIARTEVISASNAGALAQMQALGADGPAEKEWLATGDARTRESHRIASGQTVDLRDSFEVGGSHLAFPGDPAGPASEVVNCRCTLVWNMEPKAQLVAAGWEQNHAVKLPVEMLQQEEHTSGMIALIPEAPPTLEGGEPADEIHLTLWFLGDVADIPPELQKAMLTEIEARASGVGPIEASAFGAAVWNPMGEDPCVVLNVGGEEPEGARHAFGQAMVQAVADVAPTEWQLPEQHQPWAPHICLAYDPEPADLIPAALEEVGPIVFNRVRVAFGGEVHDYPLGGPEETEDAVESSQEPQ